MDNNDWRIRWQEDYLKGKTLYYHKYEPWSKNWDHEHCEFCMKKIGQTEDSFHEGYSTLDDFYWICLNCYEDFKESFLFNIFKKDEFENMEILDILHSEIELFQSKEDIFQIRRVINLVEKLKTIKSIKISISVLPIVIKHIQNKSVGATKCYLNDEFINLYGESVIMFIEILNNINSKFLLLYNNKNDSRLRLYVQIKSINSNL